MTIEPVWPERDIELVLVTGAGASRSFGVNGTQLPLMADWSEDLVTRLRLLGPGFLEATGLGPGLGGEEFEAQLGRFLRSADSFKGIQHLLHPIALTEPSRAPFGSADEWSQWHVHAAFQLEQIIAAIHESLYGLFAAPAIDPGLATQAYGALFSLLRVQRMRSEPSARWVYATTNYDTIGELAIHENGGIPDAGDVSFDTNAERPIRVERLIDGMPRYVPVLHLHGRVGWFRREGGSFASPTTRYERAAGTPIIMLPDLEKVYENVGIIEPIWEQFGEALRRAQRVLVLGHSLHDRPLIRAVVDNVDPLQRVAVTYLPAASNPSEPADPLAAAVVERVKEDLPNAVSVPMRFSAGVPLESSALLDWYGSAVASDVYLPQR